MVSSDFIRFGFGDEPQRYSWSSSVASPNDSWGSMAAVPLSRIWVGCSFAWSSLFQWRLPRQPALGCSESRFVDPGTCYGLTWIMLICLRTNTSKVVSWAWKFCSWWHGFNGIFLRSLLSIFWFVNPRCWQPRWSVELIRKRGFRSVFLCRKNFVLSSRLPWQSCWLSWMLS